MNAVRPTITPDDVFRHVPAFVRLTTDQFQALCEKAELRKTPRGGALFTEGQPAEGMFAIRSGEVKVTRISGENREQIFYIARMGRVIIEGVRFDGGTYAASSLALRPTTSYLISNNAIAELGRKHPSILMAIVDLRARRADRNMALITDLSLRTVTARLASFICTLVAVERAHGRDPDVIVRELTTETVAGRLGTVREEVSRGLAHLEKEGAVRVSPQIVEVLDLRRLESIAYGHDKRV